MKKIKLKPCPFCGGEAKLFTFGCMYVFCDNCMSTGARYQTVTQAIEAWNKRVRTMKEGADNGKDRVEKMPILW